MGGYENIMSNKGVSVLGGAKVGGCVMLSRRNAAQAANRFATFVGGLFQYAICRGCNSVCDLGSNDTFRLFHPRQPFPAKLQFGLRLGFE